MKYALILTALLLTTPTHATTPTYSCESERWVTEPVMVDHHFDGTLTATCKIVQASDGGIRALANHFLETVKKSTSIASGPISETFEGLSSVVYEITTVDQELTVSAAYHVATDSNTRVIAAEISKQIKAQGAAGWTTKRDITVDIVKLEQPGEFSATLTTHIQVKKPALIPEKNFFNAAKKIAKTQFEKHRDQNMAKIAQVL